MRSKKEVVRGMSTCGDESQKKDVLRQQYHHLTSRELALRESGSTGDKQHGLQAIMMPRQHPEDGGLDALAEAAQAHSVSNDDQSGADEEVHGSTHAAKKARRSAAGIDPVGQPGTPASADSVPSSAASQAVAPREEHFSQHGYPVFQQPTDTGVLPFPQAKMLEDVIRQMVADQRQLVQRISQLEANLAQLVGMSPHMQFQMRPMHSQMQQHAAMTVSQQQQQQQYVHQMHQYEHTHSFSGAATNSAAASAGNGNGSSGNSTGTAPSHTPHAHPHLRALGQSERHQMQAGQSPSMYMNPYPHTMPGDKAGIGTLDAQRANYYPVAKHLA